ncbi:MAG: efflux RND transporter permease subunit [Planctomycetaceae bacterium]|nr:efflux RND transporter permease subunit [Planctomycetaceae bacterium]
MRALIDFCVRERLLVLALIVLTFWLGWYSANQVPIDAIPNVGENQVIVIADWPGRSPKDVEDQLTYPISVAMQTVPGSRSVRGKSMFGFSFVQVTFDDGVDFYWARSRVAERLTAISNSLPDNVTPTLAPDATALGQIYYYVLQAPPGVDLAQLRSQQDYVIKYALQSVDGVAEVASIGGYVKQYQVDVSTEKLRFHQLTLNDVIGAIRDSNIDVGAKVIDEGGLEYLVRGKGFLGAKRTETETLEQIGQSVIAARQGTPVRVKDVAWVQAGPALRTGALDLNGSETVGGVVVMRFGENPLEVIKRLEAKIKLLEADLQGIKIVGIYDRTELIHETIATLTDALIEETLITIAVVVLFLLHFRASLIVAITLPMAVLMSFIAMRFCGVDANIMSLAGIAIAIGTMVDMGIIVLENVYVALTEWERDGQLGGEPERVNVIRRSSSEVIPAVMTAVSTTIVSFLPVFFLTGRDGRLFSPMAWTKSFALAASLLVAVIAVPMLCRIFLRSKRWSNFNSMVVISAMAGLSAGVTYFVWGPTLEAWTGRKADVFALLALVAGGLLGNWISHERLRELDENPVSRLVTWMYAGRLRLALRHKLLMLCLPSVVMVAGLVAWLGTAMVLQPVEKLATLMGANLSELPGYPKLQSAIPALKSSDWIALDEGSWFYMPSLYPAATFSQSFEVLQKQDMLIKQIPEVANVLGKIGRAESALDPAPATMIETYVMLRPKSEWRPGVTSRDIWDEINRVATVTGVTPASALQPIEGRVVMLQAGIRAAMAVRIYGQNLDELADAALAISAHLKDNPLVNRNTVSPDIVLGKPYIEFEVDREEAARYGMTAMMVNEIVAAGLGGMDVTTTVEGRERYAVQVRYERSTRESLEGLGRIEVVTPTGEIVPLDRLTNIETVWGPMSINSEDARLVAHVAFMPSGVSGPIETANQILTQLQNDRSQGKLQLPKANFELQMVGSFQNQVEANLRLMWIIPMVILINLLLHYVHFRDLPQSLIVFSGIPISAGGGMIAVALMEIPMNTAMWIGFIALFGLAADDGIVMMTYIRDELQKKRWNTIQELREIIYHAGLKRVRPCVMTTVTTLVALVPILISDGRGADVAKAMAIPIMGGMLVEPFATFVVPTLYCWFLEWRSPEGWAGPEHALPVEPS